MSTREPKRDVGLERRLNLVFALIDADNHGGARLDSGWLRAHVDGYGDPANETAGEANTGRQRLYRDIAELRRVGVPVEVSSDEDGEGSGYRLVRERYELPPISFTPDEAAVLGLAGDLGGSSELGVFARSGWTKLAAAGLDRDLSDAAGTVFTAANDLARVPNSTVAAVLKAVGTGTSVTFDYRRDRASATQRRRMDPWGLVNHADRLYLAGHDLDRDEPRTFRLLRVSAVELTAEPITHPDEGRDLQQLVAEALARGRTTVDATVRLAEGRCQELRRTAAQLDADGTAHFAGVDRDWLVRTVAGFGADAVLLTPTDARRDVVNLLRTGGEEHR